MDTITGYKDRALSSLNGKWSNAAIATLIVLLIAEGASTVITLPFEQNTGSAISALWSLLCLPLSWGLAVYFLGLIRNESLEYGKLFDGYKDFGRIFTTMFLAGLYEVLWMLLLIVPGIIKSYSYAMTGFILKDDPETSNNEAIEKSMRMMEGHKMDLFLLDLSMIGWLILSLLTLGLGLLLLIPYYESAHAHFYEDLKAESAA